MQVQKLLTERSGVSNIYPVSLDYDLGVQTYILLMDTYWFRCLKNYKSLRDRFSTGSTTVVRCLMLFTRKNWKHRDDTPNVTVTERSILRCENGIITDRHWMIAFYFITFMFSLYFVMYILHAVILYLRYDFHNK